MNFALVLFLLLLATGVLWLIDRLYARKHRAPDAPAPWWVEYGASFFPVILIVFGLRSFVVEPFKIPSGSMIPTLLVGDFILVNKWTYGIRLPVINKKIVEVGQPQRGDVMVFRKTLLMVQTKKTHGNRLDNPSQLLLGELDFRIERSDESGDLEPEEW